ncbi:MAG: lipocalin family protein [Flavisolibacter sp.]|nr:lipocalin family protein [Flavisolibacter sp.]
MQVKTSLPVCFAGVLITVFSACKKDDKKAAPSKMDLLTSGHWKMTTYTLSPPIDLDGDGKLDSDGLATFPSCKKDDFFVFKKDGTGEKNEGLTKCSASDPQAETINWAFVNDEKEIIIDNIRTTIMELAKSRLRVTVSILNSTGDITFTNIK